MAIDGGSTQVLLLLISKLPWEINTLQQNNRGYPTNLQCSAQNIFSTDQNLLLCTEINSDLPYPNFSTFNQQLWHIHGAWQTLSLLFFFYVLHDFTKAQSEI